eukprot:1000242-Amphidinium_carterae.1
MISTVVIRPADSGMAPVSSSSFATKTFCTGLRLTRSLGGIEPARSTQSNLLPPTTSKKSYM